MPGTQHTLTVQAVPREWFESVAVPVVFEVMEIALGGEDTDLRLAHGVHLEPGSKYRSPDGLEQLEIVRWDPGGETSVLIDFTDEDLTGRFDVAFADVRHPRTGAVSGDIRSTALERFKSLQRLAFTATVDLERWWEAAAKAGDQGPAALRIRLRHRLARLEIRVTPEPEPGPDQAEQWRLTVEFRARGRGLLRIPVGLGLLLFRTRLQRQIDAHLHSLMDHWDSDLDDLVKMTADELRQELLDDLASRGGDEDDADDEDYIETV